MSKTNRLTRFISGIFNAVKAKDKDINLDYYTFMLGIDKDNSIKMQEIENSRIEKSIKLEARRWLYEYNNAIELEINGVKFKNCIHIINPFIFATMIYDEETAKYKNANIYELVKLEYNKLIEEQTTRDNE